jgi:hypothetical protein
MGDSLLSGTFVAQAAAIFVVVFGYRDPEGHRL